MRGALLQFGRIVIDAETAELPEMKIPETTLQFGRIVIDAETISCDEGQRTRGKLQFGRIVIDAETRCKPGVVVWQQAASIRPHRDRCGDADTAPVRIISRVVLQFGRIVIDAETRRIDWESGRRPGGFNSAAS